jgi:hypothetical protein
VLAVSHPVREQVAQIARGLRLMLPGVWEKANLRRWGRPESLSDDWNERTERLARMIPPGSKVLEFGAGKMVLRRFLPPGCTYTPSDLVDRGPGTIVCDLNARPLPAFPPHDVALFSGVLEYVRDLHSIISHIGGSVGTIVASYAIREKVPCRIGRRAHGWISDFTCEEIEGIFARAGFRHDRVEEWGSHKLYRFVRFGPSS